MSQYFGGSLFQKIEDEGGWKNPKVVEWFGKYARACFAHFGDDVSSNP